MGVPDVAGKICLLRTPLGTTILIPPFSGNKTVAHSIPWIPKYILAKPKSHRGGSQLLESMSRTMTFSTGEYGTELARGLYPHQGFAWRSSTAVEQSPRRSLFPLSSEIDSTGMQQRRQTVGMRNVNVRLGFGTELFVTVASTAAGDVEALAFVSFRLSQTPWKLLRSCSAHISHRILYAR